MKKLILFFSLFLFIISCSNNKNLMNLSGNVKGLKKGLLLLQKIDDTLLISVDSVSVNGESSFSFSENIESPEIYFLNIRLKNGTLQDDRITFFAEPGDITINTTLKNFEIDAIITGSKNQEQLNEYSKLMQRYNNKNLDLIEQNFKARQEGNDSLVVALENEQRKLVTIKYLATVNFAIRLKDFELAPYLMVNQAYDINKKYLDTVYNNLSPKIKDSKYGKILESLIQSRSQ